MRYPLILWLLLATAGCGLVNYELAAREGDGGADGDAGAPESGVLRYSLSHVS